jgi:hypothetical protein
MNYHPFATIDTNGGFETLWYKFCILNNKRRYNFSQRIKYKTKKVNPVRNSSRCDSKPSGALNPVRDLSLSGINPALRGGAWPGGSSGALFLTG